MHIVSVHLNIFYECVNIYCKTHVTDHTYLQSRRPLSMATGARMSPLRPPPTVRTPCHRHFSDITGKWSRQWSPTSTNSPRFRVRWISQMSRGAAWFLEDFRFFILSSSFFWTSSHDFARPGAIWSFSFTMFVFWVLRGLDRTGILLLLLLATDDVVDAKDTAEGGLKNTHVMYVSTYRYFFTQSKLHR